jgi:hypothetical protein
VADDDTAFVVVCGNAETKLKATSAFERELWVFDIQRRMHQLTPAAAAEKEAAAVKAKAQAQAKRERERVAAAAAAMQAQRQAATAASAAAQAQQKAEASLPKVGGLKRKGDKFPFNSAERWFVLTDVELQWFKINQRKAVDMGSSNSQGSLKFSAGACSVREAVGDQTTFFVTCGGAEWKLIAASVLEREAWMVDIQRRMKAAGAQAIFKSLHHTSECQISVSLVQELVEPRLLLVQKRFPSAKHDDLCEALLTYSPESALFAKGHMSSEKIVDQQWEKYQGELKLGSLQQFHNGVAGVIGEDIPDEQVLQAIHDGIVRDGKPDEDRYNLWYVQHCAAVEQTNYDENGVQRAPEKVLDAGHGGMRLDDFVVQCNRDLKKAGSANVVTTAHALSMRLYTTSTFRRMNNALRGFLPKVEGGIPLRACVQSARKGILGLQAIQRAPESSFRGVTGYLAPKFEAERIGMDFAFFSTTVDLEVATEFAGSVATSVLFEVEFVAGCPGADISMLSLFPGEKEVLFVPCTGLSLKDSGKGATGAGAGQARVVVSPTAAR